MIRQRTTLRGVGGYRVNTGVGGYRVNRRNRRPLPGSGRLSKQVHVWKKVSSTLK